MFKCVLNSIFNYIKTFLKWTVLACFLGAICGAVGAVFHHLLDYVTEFRTENTFIIYFLPLAGLVIAFVYNIFKKFGNISTDRIIRAAGKDGEVPFVTVPLIFISTIITHLFGGSAGREGAALQIGGGIGYRIGKFFKFKKDDSHTITMAGMASLFSALFSTPVAAAVFAVEVANVGMFNDTSFFPCIIASGTAFFVSQFFGVAPINLGVVTFEDISVIFSLRVIVLAVVCAIVAIIFCMSIDKSEHYMKKLMPNPFVRIFVGGAIVVILTLSVGTYDYNGAGMDVVARAISGDARVYDFLLKIIFTAITIGAGFKGGEIVPSFFIGATLGCVVAPLLGIDAGSGAAIAMVSLFCAMVNCPIASVFIAIELFGSEGILFYTIACAVSYIFSAHFSLYKEQHFVYSKLTAGLYDE